MENDHFLITEKRVTEQLQLKLEAIEECLIYYISHPLNGSVFHKESILKKEENLYSLSVEHLPVGEYNLTLIDGEKLYTANFEKIA